MRSTFLSFHKKTQELCEGEDGVIVVPLIALTDGLVTKPVIWPGLGGHSWPALSRQALECDRHSLKEGLRVGLQSRRSAEPIHLQEWLNSPFRPSSSILDATISLFGNHDVAAIADHAAPMDEIENATAEIRECIEFELSRGGYHVIFLSGAPGAGKTLVGFRHCDARIGRGPIGFCYRKCSIGGGA
jgi:hypothetical protein